MIGMLSGGHGLPLVGEIPDLPPCGEALHHSAGLTFNTCLLTTVSFR